MPDDGIGESVRQALRLRRFENRAAMDVGSVFDQWVDGILDVLDQTDDERTRAAILASFNAEVEKQLPALYESLRLTGKRSSISVAFSESKKTAESLLKLSGKSGVTNPVSIERLNDIYQGDSINGLSVDQWWRHNRRKLQAGIEFETRQGMVRGESLEEIKRRIETNVLPRARRHAEALTRTSTQNLANAAIWETGEANPHLTRGYRLVVTFDRRTSQICLAYGARNKIYPYLPSSPRPPFHFNCRTLIQPVLIGKESEKPVDAGVWLKRQSKETQDEILGPRRAELFRKGRIDLSDLIRNDNSITSIPELLGVGVSFQL